MQNQKIAENKKQPSNTHLNSNFFGNTKKTDFFSPATIQPKLTIGQPNDKYEKEADAMADKVVSMGNSTSAAPVMNGSPNVQAKCADCEQEESIQRMTEEEKGGTIQKMGGEEEEMLQTKPLMRKSDNGGGVGTAALSSQLSSTKGSGSALPKNVNQQMSGAFGTDFSGVRVHTGGDAVQMNQGLGARAFTHGSDVYFNKGEYNPGSTEGKRLLGHELTHVVQQGGGGDLNTNNKLQKKGLLKQSLFMTNVSNELEKESKKKPFATSINKINNKFLIQKAASFSSGPINATTNMALHLIAGNRNAGFTPPTLNGTQVLSTATARTLINKPTIGGRTNPDGTATCWVSNVNTNLVSFTMQLPTNGPWSTVTAKSNAVQVFNSLFGRFPIGCNSRGDTNFSVKGKPSDAGFAANVRTHELLHATDHETGFNSILKPWDEKLERAKTSRTQFNGATPEIATANLYIAMGGTPDEIAERLFNEWIRLNNITHRGRTLATGGSATPSNSTANASCTTSSIDVT